MVLAVAAVFWFPPLALVLAGLGLYSAYRARAAPRDRAMR
jgi:cytochrome c-type biogenesis protein CcmH/NrfF